MITSDQEQQVKLQFLEEATDYLDSIEAGLLGLGAGEVSGKQLDGVLRAAHSIKGGAGMMGYTTLAGLGHHLEDYFKILQYGKVAKPDGQLEQLLLGTVDRLRQIIVLNQQGKDADQAWLAKQVQPLFDQLRERLGEFNPEDEANMLASESGEDILTFLFESEVERCLDELETIIASGNNSNLAEELTIGAEELGGLAEMVELPAMGSLCQSVIIHIQAQPHQIDKIAALAVAAWRRTQAMVLIGQTTNLPREIELPGSGIEPMPDAETATSDWSDIDLNELEPPIESGSIDLNNFDFDRVLSINDLQAVNDNFSHADSTAGDWNIAEMGDLLTQPNRYDDETLSIGTFAETTYDQDLSEMVTIAEIGPDMPTLADPADLANAFSSQQLDGFERLDLSGDLSMDTDASEFFAAISNFSPPISSALKPAQSQRKQNNHDLDQEMSGLLDALEAAPEVAGELLIGDDESGIADRKQAPQVQQAEQTIRVATKQLEQIGDLFGELTIDRNGLNLQLRGLRQLVVNLNAKVKQLEQSNVLLRAAYDGAAGEGQQPPETWTQTTTPTLSSDLTDNLDLLEFDRYSDLHILSQEVMDTIVQIEELISDLDTQLNDTERTSRDLNRTAKQLETGLTQVRMRPISDLFNRFPRAIRNLSIEHSKPIDLKFKGSTTLIERSVLEALNDPLMHLLRNAFDHGIEPAATRTANGKSALGTIEIGATYRGNQTVITIKDDGGGIDLDKIRAKVKKMGVNDQEIANFKDSELVDLIFEPGFSTAAKVTDLSGRGVGMDVVRTNIRSLRGDIFVDTKLGQGSTFTITVPFTLSVVRVLLVEVNGLWLAIPSNIVEEIILLNRDRVITTAGQMMLQWEGFTVRMIQPKQHLQLPDIYPQQSSNAVPTIDCPTVLMIDQGQDIVALEIDKFWGEQEVTIRQPQGNIKMPPGFTGCTILGDGRVVPLVDAIEFIRWIDGEATTHHWIGSPVKLGQEPATPTPSPSAQKQRPRILVVDDSINVRRFVALTLEKAGYQVEQAKDGQEAVEKLQAGLSAQAVVCDIEMPRMDGYGFLATIKGQSQFKNLPVLMLTSRSGDKHRKIAMNLGATGYFSKPFKEQELLATLSELVGK